MEYQCLVLPTFKTGVQRFYEIDIDDTAYLTIHFNRVADATWKSINRQAEQYFEKTNSVGPENGSGICWKTNVYNDTSSSVSDSLVLTNNLDDSSLDIALRIPFSQRALDEFTRTEPEFSGCCKFLRDISQIALHERDLLEFGSTETNL